MNHYNYIKKFHFYCLVFILFLIIYNLFFRQVIIVLTQLEGSGGFSIAHKLTHRLANQAGLHDWGPPGCSHLPQIQKSIEGLHSPRLIT